MKKLFPIFSYICYAALSAWAILSLKADVDAIPEKSESIGDGIGNGIGVGISTLFIYILAIYLAVTVVALVFKLLHNGTRFVLFGAVSVLLDLVFLVAHGFIFYYLFTGGGDVAMFTVFGGLSVLSLASLLSNASSF